MKKRYINFILGMTATVVSVNALFLPQMLAGASDLGQISYVRKDYFSQLPSGTQLEADAEIWKQTDWFPVDNVLTGDNRNQTKVNYAALWDSNHLYFSIQVEDSTPLATDSIEVALTYRGEQWGYILGNMDPWLGSTMGDRAIPQFIDLEQKEEVRMFIFSVELRDTTPLRSKNTISVNVNYYDYAMVNENSVQLCRLQTGSRNDGAASVVMPLAEKPGAKYSETPDYSLYDNVFALYNEKK